MLKAFAYRMDDEANIVARIVSGGSGRGAAVVIYESQPGMVFKRPMPSRSRFIVALGQQLQLVWSIAVRRNANLAPPPNQLKCTPSTLECLKHSSVSGGEDEAEIAVR